LKKKAVSILSVITADALGIEPQRDRSLQKDAEHKGQPD
jgi:hypothetical protein